MLEEPYALQRAYVSSSLRETRFILVEMYGRTRRIDEILERMSFIHLTSAAQMALCYVSEDKDITLFLRKPLSL
jgi:hypothetical protein